jgi:lantibiotic biosynthesis protein
VTFQATAGSAGPAVLRPRAQDVAVDVASRLADPGTLTAAIEAARSQTTLTRGVQWRDHTVAAGYAGTALLFAAVDACQPAQGWDRAGHRHLAAACDAMAAAPSLDSSLFGGLAGVGYAAVQLAAGRQRYTGLLTSLDDVLVPTVRRAAARLDALDGCSVGAFDLISGLTGAGVYLLARRGDPGADASLRLVLEVLTRLLGHEGKPRRWHTPAGLVAGPMGEAYPDGNHNCGMAHGLPGPLALLSIAVREGVSVDGIDAAIDTAARWLVEHRLELPSGPDWPNAVGLSHPDGDAAEGSVPSRATWCYGAPGVARALWLAGTALAEDEYRDLALRAIRAALARPPDRRGITSPAFCHGLAGLVQIADRFARDTGSAELAASVDGLVAELLGAYEPGSLLGFRNVEPGGVRVDQPGLLDGAPGIALTLLAADTDGDPAWDRLFLLA